MGPQLWKFQESQWKIASCYINFDTFIYNGNFNVNFMQGCIIHCFPKIEYSLDFLDLKKSLLKKVRKIKFSSAHRHFDEMFYS